MRNKELGKALHKKIEEAESAAAISHISHLKKLRNYSSRYKIEIVANNKIYWALCIVRGKNCEFVRLKSEKYFKKNL